MTIRIESPSRLILGVAALAILAFLSVGCNGCGPGRELLDLSTPYFDLDLGGERDRRSKYQPAPVAPKPAPKKTVEEEPIACSPSCGPFGLLAC